MVVWIFALAILFLFLFGSMYVRTYVSSGDQSQKSKDMPGHARVVELTQAPSRPQALQPRDALLKHKLMWMPDGKQPTSGRKLSKYYAEREPPIRTSECAEIFQKIMEWNDLTVCDVEGWTLLLRAEDAASYSTLAARAAGGLINMAVNAERYSSLRQTLFALTPSGAQQHPRPPPRPPPPCPPPGSPSRQPPCSPLRCLSCCGFSDSS